MSWLRRDPNNPLLMPRPNQEWDCAAAFNPCAVQVDGVLHLVYRAQGPQLQLDGRAFSQSCIGYARSVDGLHFDDRRLIIQPELPWERFGCEDPRLTRIDDRYFIFYTCLSVHPFHASGIRVAMAITRDFVHFEKHPVTPFNAKAMALFPERIGGRLVAILTVHTDMPPAKIAIACFDREQDLWSEQYWLDWYRHLDQHVVALLRSPADHVEVGAPPLRTDNGWLLVHSYIRDYFTEHRSFGIEAALLALDDPQRVCSRTSVPLMRPEKEYELKGSVANVVFPSGALIEAGELVVHYGAADTVCCAARGNLDELLSELVTPVVERFVPSPLTPQGFQRFSANPILSPRPEFAWEALAVFNPGAILLGGRVHLIYRAMAADGTSTLGYASSADGVHFDVRLPYPIYEPRAAFEQKLRPGNSGCEDPRLSLLGETLYLFYTAFDSYTPRVAFATIGVADFLAQRWNWSEPMVITPPGIDDKDACLMPRLINGSYVIFHRAGDCIRVNSFASLKFGAGHWVDNKSALIKPRKEYWDNRKFGIASPPIETPHGWLLFFHRVTQPHAVYKIEAMLLARDDPTQVIAETAASLLEPETPEEHQGQVANVVFPCGSAVLNGDVYLYYGGADSVICLARMPLASIYKRLGI
jgi:predicted GH43/DUF377 family glycosyl hydrolase